jgi:hypothetical protein
MFSLRILFWSVCSSSQSKRSATPHVPNSDGDDVFVRDADSQVLAEGMLRMPGKRKGSGVSSPYARIG